LVSNGTGQFVDVSGVFQNYTVHCVQIFKDAVYFAGAQKLKAHEKKMKMAEEVLDRIQWDPVFQDKMSSTVVGYKDRFYGVLEISYAEFRKSEIKAHRIFYIKHGDEVVWDRLNKINKC